MKIIFDYIKNKFTLSDENVITKIPDYYEFLPEKDSGSFQSFIEINYYVRGRKSYNSRTVYYDIHSCIQKAYRQSRIMAYKKDNMFCLADEINWCIKKIKNENSL